MRVRQLVLSMFIAFVPCLLIEASPQKSALSRGQKLGTIKGEVRSGYEQLLGPWTVVIEGGSVKREISTDEKGTFAITLPAGVYTAHVKPATRVDRKAEHVPFRVPPGQQVRIVLDPTEEYVYCTAAGERIIPMWVTDSRKNSVKGLHRPQIDSFAINPSDKSSLKVVIEYCGKIQTGKLIAYKSPIVRFNTTDIFADDAEFDNQTYLLSSQGRIGVIQNGARIETSQIKAGFRGHDKIEMSTDSGRLRKPRP